MTSDGSIVFEASINDKNAQTKLNPIFMGFREFL